jgi:MFS transporter, DHA1 family, tetracycline resistance protein
MAAMPESEANKETPTANRAAVTFIFIVLMLDVLAMGVVIPVLPKLIEELSGATPADAVRLGGWIALVWAVSQFVATPLQGALSDRFGRRPVLLISMTGLGLDYILTALAPSIAWLFIARAISGATAASFSTANAYIADTTPPEKRPQAFGLMGAAFGIGFVIGPALGGVAGAYDPRLPFWVAAGLTLLNALYGYFVLPESLPPERRAKSFSFANANFIASLRLLASNAQLTGLGAAHFFYAVAHNVYPAVFLWFTMYRYGWSETTNGIALALTGVCSIIVQAGLIGPVVKRLGPRRAMITGLSFGIVGFLIYAIGPTDISVWIAIPIAALWGFYTPAAQTIMTQRVDQSSQGQLQGALAALMGIASIISPPLYTHVFASSIDASTHAAGWPILGAPFFLAAALLGCAFIGVLFATRPQAHGN